MDHFQFRQNTLYAESIALETIAESAGTPCFVYTQATLLEHLRRFQDAFSPLAPAICFAVKSCSNLAILSLLADAGADMDIVSGGELARVLAAGIDPDKCVFAGVGKTDEEIAFALREGVGLFNCESAPEFENIASIAAREGKRARVALRVNPDVDAVTHRHTTTGVRATKFGVDLEDAPAFFERYAATESCDLCGLHVHIGSPVRTTAPYVAAIQCLLELVDTLESRGWKISTIDIGGGFAADYETGEAPSAAMYADAIIPLLQKSVARGVQIILEPGRSIAANAGVLLTRVQYIKQAGNRRFAILDAGMHTLLRPSHYDAFHFAWPCTPRNDLFPESRAKTQPLAGLETYDLVGPICETGDYLALERQLPPLERGDLVAVFGCGAYGMSMASRYNSMPLPAEVLVSGESMHLIRRREVTEDLFSHEEVPAPIRHFNEI